MKLGHIAIVFSVICMVASVTAFTAYALTAGRHEWVFTVSSAAKSSPSNTIRFTCRNEDLVDHVRHLLDHHLTRESQDHTNKVSLSVAESQDLGVLSARSASESQGKIVGLNMTTSLCQLYAVFEADSRFTIHRENPNHSTDVMARGDDSSLGCIREAMASVMIGFVNASMPDVKPISSITQHSVP